MKLWSRISLLALVTVSIFVLAGCATPVAGNNPVVGKWRGTLQTPSQGPVETWLDFKPEGKVTLTSIASANAGTGQVAGGTLKIIMEGTYGVQGNRLQGKFATVSGDNNQSKRPMPDHMGILDTTFEQTGDNLRLKLGPNDPVETFTREGKQQ